MKFSSYLACLLMTCIFSAFAQEKVVLISGGTGGLGLATAKAFERKGWKVWAGYRGQIPEEKNIHFIYLDVTKEASVQEAVSKIIQEEGRIDALVNNAGYGLIGAEEDFSIEEVQKLLDVNFLGCLRLIQAVLPSMRSQMAGHIINISSTSGIRAVPGLGLYAASKFALEGMSESLAVTLSPWNIHVSLVEPGTVNNQWTTHCCLSSNPTKEPIYKKMSQALSEKLSKWAPGGQDCNDVAALIVKIASDDNPDLRYQTWQKAQDVVAKKLVDLTGNKMRDEQKAFFKSLIGQ
ncbi:MAG: SDR family oxidoreductase [Verrucomicrobia bacterium]|nr:SDR family oxidoreductase [Verrucomicrobiota bacterium]